MKSKAKLDKIRKTTTNKVSRDLPQGWIIMSRSELTVSAIRDIVGNENIEVWPEVGVLEIPIGEKTSIDIEEFDTDPRDEYSCRYVAENSVKKLFYVSFRPEDYDAAEVILKKISSAINGFVCADTEDFEPHI